MKVLVLAITHALAAAAGFALGIYLLPILIAPQAPTAAEVKSAVPEAAYTGTFRRDLSGSDALHWGEGKVSIGRRHIAFEGKLAPGPDYKLYLSPEYVETKEGFLRMKSQMVRVADVKTFENFLVAVPEGIDPARYKAAIVWCETFSMFITAARYQ
jgi:hypothetical protein